jgi:alanine racemase
MRATRAIIHLDNLQHNIRLVQEQVGRKVKICIAVKADAYGNGAVEVAQAGIKSGVFALGVATVLEGIELRQADIKSPILLYSLPIPEEIPEIVKYDITPLVADEDFIIALWLLSFTGAKKNFAVKARYGINYKSCLYKKSKKGTPVSYGMTYKTGEETKIATLPLGYADGYNRLLSNKGDVFVKNKRYKICGRVCMDQCMIDIGIKSDIKLYEDVTLFGPNPQGPDGEEIAILLNSIPYEVTCNISKRVPRIYLSS